MDKPVFIMMCGLVASGKSYKAKELAKDYDATIFSSDDLREELFGDVNNQEHNQEVFIELHRRIKECLRGDKSAIMDSTNISYKRRLAFLQELKNIPCEKICVLMATPYEECLRRNAERERKVPEYAIEKMYRQFDPPYWYEGWKEEVVNCVIWRQQDATRNSINSVGQANFSHKQLQNKSCNDVQDMLMSEKGINWNDYTTTLKRGSCCIKMPQKINDGTKQEYIRNKWIIDNEIPIFTQDREYINSRIFV